jgi:DNA uptake protein ComE-like DNA-binding protein
MLPDDLRRRYLDRVAPRLVPGVIAGALLVVHVAVATVAVRSQADTTPLAVEAAAIRIDPNTASAAELQLLPQVGPKLAAYIVAYRTSVAGTAFHTPGDLVNVHRIGPLTAERLAPHLRFEPPSATSRPTTGDKHP